MTLFIFIEYREKILCEHVYSIKTKKLKAFFVVFNVLYARSSLDFHLNAVGVKDSMDIATFKRLKPMF